MLASNALRHMRGMYANNIVNSHGFNCPPILTPLPVAFGLFATALVSSIALTACWVSKFGCRKALLPPPPGCCSRSVRGVSVFSRGCDLQTLLQNCARLLRLEMARGGVITSDMSPPKAPVTCVWWHGVGLQYRECVPELRQSSGGWVD